MTKMSVWLATGAAALALCGCATGSNDIGSSFSSPIIYQGASCQQLAMEDETVISHATQLSGQINQRSTNDKIMMGVGIVVFWPALFFVKGDGPQAAEYAALKGRHDAIQQAAAYKGCAGSSVSYSRF